jgi:hypothetical protein
MNATPPSSCTQPPDRASTTKVARLRLTARCLDLRPVFVSDVPLIAEIFDQRGNHVETWGWA